MGALRGAAAGKVVAQACFAGLGAVPHALPGTSLAAPSDEVAWPGTWPLLVTVLPQAVSRLAARWRGSGACIGKPWS
ncbi:hypothetical protein D9599_15885 [Roseomonas sp. KE2513]|nr:hypothetical protein [Roseomonas sp. KE2513]